jgi:hypothetical protein
MKTKRAKKPAARPRSRSVGFRDFCAAARKLPDVEISTSYGTPALKVKGRMILRMHDKLDAVVLRVDFISRQILMQADPQTFFITDHYKNYPAMLVRLSAVNRAALPDLVERAWRQVAPARLVEKHDQAGADS